MQVVSAVGGVKVSTLQSRFLLRFHQQFFALRVEVIEVHAAVAVGAGRDCKMVCHQLPERRPQAHHQAPRQPELELFIRCGVDADQQSVVRLVMSHRQLVDVHATDFRQFA